MDYRDEPGNDHLRSDATNVEERVKFVYLPASKPSDTLYLGVTSNIIGRRRQHKEGVLVGFSKKYGTQRLVWYETFGDIYLTIQREKTMKHWSRHWKINVIEKDNPDWDDLYPKFFETDPRLF